LVASELLVSKLVLIYTNFWFGLWWYIFSSDKGDLCSLIHIHDWSSKIFFLSTWCKKCFS